MAVSLIVITSEGLGYGSLTVTVQDLLPKERSTFWILEMGLSYHLENEMTLLLNTKFFYHITLVLPVNDLQLK